MISTPQTSSNYALTPCTKICRLNSSENCNYKAQYNSTFTLKSNRLLED